MAVRTIQHCTDKSRLLAEYNRGVMAWSDAVRSLSDHAGSDDFRLLMTEVDEARARTQRAKTEYVNHIADHGC